MTRKTDPEQGLQTDLEVIKDFPPLIYRFLFQSLFCFIALGYLVNWLVLLIFIPHGFSGGDGMGIVGEWTGACFIFFPVCDLKSYFNITTRLIILDKVTHTY